MKGHTIHPAIVGIMYELPKPGSSWTQADKERWMAAFTAILDFIYPVIADASIGHSAQEGGV